ncbi:MAG: hypothetical protein NC084_00670 [Bacteroides sp.]|nr:hypothetical protein [Eubacterium sp.]MCM1417177.1 hypothetical protein [Roseburia sp.]MCM1461202.1 hypothetical protein [Bacteroides sp.]
MGSGMNEAAMLGALLPLLLSGEGLEAALYCGYKGTGFFASGRSIVTGYIGITDRDRLVGQKTGLLDVSAFAEELKDLKKLKISGALFGQKQVYFLFLGEKKREIKIQIASKVYGNTFPDQEKNFHTFLARLEEKRAALPD